MAAYLTLAAFILRIFAESKSPSYLKLKKIIMQAAIGVKQMVGEEKTQSIVLAKNLRKHYPLTKGVVLKKILATVKAVDDISFEINRGETLSLVGESGSGKSTTARMITGLEKPTAGKIFLDQKDISSLNTENMRLIRKIIGMVFQDPFSSLDPRQNILQIVSEPMRIHKVADVKERKEKAIRMIERVGLRTEDLNRYPHQFSGGQRQRIAIARALILSPQLLVADEPVSSLDVSVQAKTINLMIDLQKEFRLAYLFIAHDLSVVRHISDRVAIMYLGKIFEQGSVKNVFDKPLHPYTHALLSAVPVLDPTEMKSRKQIMLKGEIPSPINPPPGCRFHTRCPYAKQICLEKEPPTTVTKNNHSVACYFWEEISSGKASINNV